MNHKKGFTLIELVTVIAIITVLAGILMPQITGFISGSKDSVCLNNLATLNRIYKQQVAIDDAITPEMIILNNDSQYYAGSSQCPSTQITYTVENGVIVCLNHKQEVTQPDKDLPLYQDMLKKQEGIEKCLSQTQGQSQCLTELYGTFYFSNDKFCEYYYAKNGGKWDLLDKNLALQAGLNIEKNYYVRPFFTANKIPLVFASTSNSVKSPWYSDMIYYGDKWYKLDKTILMTDLNSLSQSQIEDYLAKNAKSVK